MMMTTQWKVAPTTELKLQLKVYTDKVRAAVLAVAKKIALWLERDAKQNAPWTDDSGAARDGLFATAEAVSESIVRIYLSHGLDVDYGAALELANGGKFATITPTIQRNVAEIQRMLQSIFQN